MSRIECHITLRVKDRPVADQVAAEAGGWKTSQMLDDPVLGDGEWAYLTINGDEYGPIKAKMDEMRDVLQESGVHPVRYKIEETLFDERNLQGTWMDKAIVDDPRIEHENDLVRNAAEYLHRNESMHLHNYIEGVVCPYCALRTTRVLQRIKAI